MGNETISEARERRCKLMVAHVAANHHDADDWDLAFWQECTPQQRLSALVALRNDLAAIHGNRSDFDWDGD